MTRVFRSAFIALALVVLIFSRAAVAQEPHAADDRPPTKAQQNEDYGVATTVVVGGLLGLGVALAAVAITRGAWGARRGPREDADESVKRLG